MKATSRTFVSLLLAAVLTGAAASAAAAAVRINEIRTDNTGTDSDEYFELIGLPGQSLAGLTYLVIGDATAGKCGVIESVTDLSAFSLQADGLLALRKDTDIPVLTGYDGAVSLSFENADNVTHLLVSGFTGSNGQDLDTNDDGVLDVTPWTAVVDCVGLDKGTVPDCISEEYLYCGTHVGPDGAYVPGHVYRASDTQAWIVGSFGPVGMTDTPGEPNFSSLGPPPIYVDMTRDPCVPLTGQWATIVMRARNNPTHAELRYSVNGGAETAIAMDVLGTSADTVTYFAQIPGQAVDGAMVEYYCNVWNVNPNPSRSYGEGYFAGTKPIGALRVNEADGSNRYGYYGARIRGRVTVGYGVLGTVNTEYYVQDGTGGIQLFDYGPHTVQPVLGDSIVAAGAISQYSGNLELAGVGSCDTLMVSIVSHGAPPAPREVTTCDVGETTEGLLVHTRRLLLSTGGDLTFTANKEYKGVNCYKDTIRFYVDPETNVAGSPITSELLDVTGIAGQWDTAPPYDFFYRITPRSLSDLAFLSPTGVDDGAGVTETRLGPCMPTPVRGTAEIRYALAPPPRGGMVHTRLAIYDLRGREVARLVDGPMAPGPHVATLDRGTFGRHGNGVYFYRLEAGGVVLTRKLIRLGE